MAETEAVVAGDRRNAPLALEAERFRAIGHEMVDRIAEFLAVVPAGPVTPGESPTELRALLGDDAPIPEAGEDAGAVLASAAELLFRHSLFNGHPRFFGYITSSPAPIGMLGDFLAAAANANVGGWQLAPIATEIETQAVRWIADLIGFGHPCGGLMVSGGNMANFLGFFAARAAAADWGLREGGLRGPGSRDLRVYGSAETHTWIHKAADIGGLGTDAIRWIPTDERQRMDVDALCDAIRRDREAGAKPMMVVGAAGTVSTGAVDPLLEIAELCRRERTWFHIDGAYGGFAAAVPGLSPDFAAFRLADSIAIDPHKWLYAPLEAGCTLVRDPATLRAAFSYHPPYYHFGVEALNYFDHGMQNSRGFRALKVWLALRQVGREGYVRMIGDDIRLSRRMHAAVAAHPELEAATQELSISTFRYVPAELRPDVGNAKTEEYLNRLNEALLERIQESGEAFVSNAVVRGRFLLRACIVNFNTDAADVDAIPEIVARMGKEVDRGMRDATV